MAIRETFEFLVKSKGANKLDDLREDIEDTTEAIEDQGDAAEKSTSKNNAFAKALSGLGKAAKVAAVSVAAVAAIGIGAAVGAVTTAVNDFQDFEAAMKHFEIQTGATGDALLDYKETAKDLFTQGLGGDFDEVARAMASVHDITGSTGDALEVVTRKALIFSEAFDRDVNEALRTADIIAETWGTDAGEAFDILAGGIKATGDPAEDLLDTFNEYSANFEDLGFGPVEALNLLNQGLEAGARNTDDIADGIREFGIRLRDGTSEQALMNLGLEEMNAKFIAGEESGASMLESVLGALNEIEDPLERNAAGVEIFGTKWEDVGESAFLALDPTSDSIGQLGDSIEEANAVLQRGLGPTWQRFNRTLRVSLMTAIGPLIADGLNALIPLLEQLTDLFIKDGIPALLAFIDVVADGIKWTIEFAKAIVQWLGGADRITEFFKDFGREIVKAGESLRDFFKELMEGFEVGGISEVGRLILDKLLTGLGNIGSFIKDALVEPLFNAIRDIDWTSVPGILEDLLMALFIMGMPVAVWFHKNVIEPVIKYISEINWEAIPGQLLKILDALMSMAQGVGEWLKTHFVDPLVSAISNIDWASVPGMLGEILLKLFTMTMKVGTWLNEHLVTPLVDKIRAIDWSVITGKFDDILEALFSMEPQLSAWLQVNVVDRITTELTEIDWASIPGQLDTLLAQVLGSDTPVSEQISELFWGPLQTGLGDSAEVQNVATKAGEIASTLLDGLKTGLGDLKTWVVDNIFGPLFGTGDDGVDTSSAEGAGEATGKSFLDGLVGAIGNIGEWVLNNIIVPFGAGFTGESTQTVKDNIALFVGDMILALNGLHTRVVDEIITPIINLFADSETEGSLANFFANFPETAKGWIGFLADGAKALGDGFVDAFTAALASLAVHVIDALNEAIPNSFSIDFGFPIGNQGINIPDNPIPGGSRDMGGPGSAGYIYQIGKGPYTEYFIPDTAGQFIPERRMGMGATGGGDGMHISGGVHLHNVVNERDMARRLARLEKRQNKEKKGV